MNMDYRLYIPFLIAFILILIMPLFTYTNESDNTINENEEMDFHYGVYAVYDYGDNVYCVTGRKGIGDEGCRNYINYLKNRNYTIQIINVQDKGLTILFKTNKPLDEKYVFTVEPYKR
jgi:hypothetical protein